MAYYPGCALHGTAKEYDQSSRAVCRELGIELEEPYDWNCCGASSAHALDQELALLLPARNLKIIAGQNLDVIIPCAACFSRIKTCAHTLKNDSAMRARIAAQLNFSFDLQTKVYHLLEFLVSEIGLEKIKRHLKKPFAGLPLVCYYGCLLVRPHNITQLDDKENPEFLDQLMSLIGGSPRDWPYKTECCGAFLSLSQDKLVEQLVDKMITSAKEAGAQAIVTACPLCQANLEMRQGRYTKFPVFYFTELLGLAFGLKEITVSLKKHLIDTTQLLKEAKL